jgi:hypothetical protein
MEQIIGLIVVTILLGWIALKWLDSSESKSTKSLPPTNNQGIHVEEKPTLGSRILISVAVAALCIPGAVLIPFLAVAIKGTGGEDWLVNLIGIGYTVLSFLFIGYAFLNPKRKISKHNKK